MSRCGRTGEEVKWDRKPCSIARDLPNRYPADKHKHPINCGTCPCFLSPRKELQKQRGFFNRFLAIEI
jgi:hypothetical protein